MKNTIERFWSKVNKTDGCWFWTGAKSNWGYGNMKAGNKYMRSHRFSWELVNGKIPERKFVLHRCDNPACVRPEHLFIGTAKENTLDMMAKGRLKVAIGERQAFHKLTESQVIEIKKFGPGRYSDRAMRFGVDESTIRGIATGKWWKHLNHFIPKTDKQRLDWLDSDHGASVSPGPDCWQVISEDGFEIGIFKTLREAIDDAMRSEKKP